MVDWKKNSLWQVEEKLSLARDVSNQINEKDGAARAYVYLDKSEFVFSLSQEIKTSIVNLIEKNLSLEDNINFARAKIHQEIIELFAKGPTREELCLYLEMTGMFCRSELDLLKGRITDILKEKSKQEREQDPFYFYLNSIKNNIQTYLNGGEEGIDMILELFDLAFSSKGISPSIFDSNPNLLPTFQALQKELPKSKYSIQILLPGTKSPN